MHAILTALAPYLVTALVAAAAALATLLVARLKGWLSSPAAAQHPIEASAATLAVEVANDAIALLRSSPSLTPAAIVDWAKAELQAKAAGAAISIGGAAASAGINELVRKSLLSVAQGGSLDAAATAIIAAMAPTAATAKITPPQVAAVLADVAAASPDIEAAIEAKLPDILAAVMKMLGTAPAAPVPTDAPAAPVLAAA